MTTETTLSEPVAFFTEHAGYSYDPKHETPEEGRLRCALELAEAGRIEASPSVRRGSHRSTRTSAENQDAELVQRYAEIVGFYE